MWRSETAYKRYKNLDLGRQFILLLAYFGVENDEQKAQHDIVRKLKVLNYAKNIGNVSKTCRYFGICRETFYTWKRSYQSEGEIGLIDSRPCPENHKLRLSKPIEEKIIHLRTTYHFGPDMIVWHLQRYHDIKVSRNGCYQVLLRNKLNRLPENIKKRSRNKFK